MEMVRIPEGTLLMGSTEFYPEEGPVHERHVAAFELDAHPVTNAEFARFVEETGYVTVAERPLDPADFPGADPDALVEGSTVFTPTDGPVDLRDWRQWWRWQPVAHWRHPFGPDSAVDALGDHPVVHVAFEDAEAYARWAGKRLATEAEWEWAARGGLVGARFAWGDELRLGELANTWLGAFPYRNEGWGGTSPVASYPANGYGLHDMIGNVWEWTASLWTPRHVVPGSTPVDAGGRRNLFGADASGTGPARRVTKGGSHLCAPEYCQRYRPAARSSQTEDSATTHLGFRCARDADAASGGSFRNGG